MLIKGPIWVVVLVVPHDEGVCWNLEKLCLGICGGGEVVVWLVQGGVRDYVMEAGLDNCILQPYTSTVYFNSV
jgi:hypothetical protein